jgi:hypothetical protein
MLGISESRWTGSGQRILSTVELLLYSEHNENDSPLTQRLTIMISKQAQGALTGMESTMTKSSDVFLQNTTEKDKYENHKVLLPYK